MPITEITHDGKSWVFQMGRSVIRCDDYVSLMELRNELIQQNRKRGAR